MENNYILITGGAGSIGSELVRQLAPKNTIHIIDIDETRMFDLVEEMRLAGYKVTGEVFDVRNKYGFRHGSNYPNIIFHCAARKHVTPMEDTPMEAVEVNIVGTHNVLWLARKVGARLINISTDKVVNADCIMGATKRVAELMVKNAGDVSVRFGNIMGSRGSVIPIWQKQLDEGKSLTVTDPLMTRYMMTIEDACALVIQVAQTEGLEGKVIVLDMGKPIEILQLAKEILKKSGRPIDDFKLIGRRPGEQLKEKLMSEEEEKRAIKKNNFFII